MGIHLTGNTEVGQIFRIPELISHYLQHHRQNSDISFFTFIAMHYGGDDGTTADDEYDGKLPCHNLRSNTLSLLFSPMIKELAPQQQVSGFRPEFTSRTVRGISSQHVSRIFQPPRA